MLQSNQNVEEQDKLAILRREIKLKKIMFSELPSDFVYFKQYNISSKQMYENLLALHSVDQFNQEVITVEDVYEATDLLDSPAAQSQTKRKKSAAPTSAESELDFQWPLEEEEFVITLEEDGWNFGSVQSYNQEQDTICVQALTTLKTRAKDDVGKTYRIYPTEEEVDHFEKKHVLEIRPSVTLAKNIKRKDLVFSTERSLRLFGDNSSTKMYRSSSTMGTILF